jgi:hypothetical protein
VLGDVTNQAALPRRIWPSTTYGGCEFATPRSVHQEAVLESYENVVVSAWWWPHFACQATSATKCVISKCDLVGGLD